MTKSNFNLQLNHIRAMWGLRQGTSLIWTDDGLCPVGYINVIQQPPVNDNEAKP